MSTEMNQNTVQETTFIPYNTERAHRRKRCRPWVGEGLPKAKKTATLPKPQKKPPTKKYHIGACVNEAQGAYCIYRGKDDYSVEIFKREHDFHNVDYGHALGMLKLLESIQDASIPIHISASSLALSESIHKGLLVAHYQLIEEIRNLIEFKKLSVKVRYVCFKNKDYMEAVKAASLALNPSDKTSKSLKVNRKQPKPRPYPVIAVKDKTAKNNSDGDKETRASTRSKRSPVKPASQRTVADPIIKEEELDNKDLLNLLNESTSGSRAKKNQVTAANNTSALVEAKEQPESTSEQKSPLRSRIPRATSSKNTNISIPNDAEVKSATAVKSPSKAKNTQVIARNAKASVSKDVKESLASSSGIKRHLRSSQGPDVTKKYKAVTVGDAQNPKALLAGESNERPKGSSTLKSSLRSRKAQVTNNISNASEVHNDEPKTLNNNLRARKNSVRSKITQVKTRLPVMKAPREGKESHTASQESEPEETRVEQKTIAKTLNTVEEMVSSENTEKSAIVTKEVPSGAVMNEESGPKEKHVEQETRAKTLNIVEEMATSENTEESAIVTKQAPSGVTVEKEVAETAIETMITGSVADIDNQPIEDIEVEAPPPNTWFGIKTIFNALSSPFRARKPE